MIHVHQLDGCAPAPLAHYLKALGILRLVAEQADRDARGWWNGDHFRLATKLCREELDAFFLNDYRPTPLVSPRFPAPSQSAMGRTSAWGCSSDPRVLEQWPHRRGNRPA